MGPFEFESGPIVLNPTESGLVGAVDPGGGTTWYPGDPGGGTNKQVEDFLGLPGSLCPARLDPALLTGLFDIVPSDPGQFSTFGPLRRLFLALCLKEV